MTRVAQRAPSAHLATLAQAGTTALYPANATIFQQAEEADGLYYLEDGLVKIDVASRQGKRAVIALLGPDTFFGEGCLAGQVLRTATAVALLETRLVHIRKSAMLHLLQSDLSFAQQFTTLVVQRVVRVEEDVIDLLFNSTKNRLAKRAPPRGNISLVALPPVTGHRAPEPPAHPAERLRRCQQIHTVTNGLPVAAAFDMSEFDKGPCPPVHRGRDAECRWITRGAECHMPRTCSAIRHAGDEVANGDNDGLASFEGWMGHDRQNPKNCG